ncbi:hypothetical protein [Winogradskyella sp. SYSU M77433]|uniref:hypothetical protein n=1 Tax=Winogradskyella sp. SYSU M77433 TaxID=3042722 RepID=UPI00247FABCF|nr:hypothetical protein [Winogradskyella sp. SYSU M77433]MDH7914640.1 hypothetical protein [Winogradskyella sp. SYSU M77433]
MTDSQKKDFKDIGLTCFPWIGNNYENGGIFNKKILILGESHYGTDKDAWFNENLTRLSIQQKIGEATGENGKFYKKAFHTNIFKAFNEKPATNENKVDFWHSVAYFNYVQGSVGDKPRVRPIKEDWEKSFQPTLDSIKLLKPDLIVVLGYTLWKNIWHRFENDVYEKTTFNNNHNIHKLRTDNNPLMFCIKHPSSGFSSNYFRPEILKYINEK